MKRILYLIQILALTITGVAQQKSLCDVTYIYEVNSVNQLIDFTNKAYAGPKVINWQWDFGDGTSSNQPNPRHVYMERGSYVACLTIITEDNCENTFCDTIKVGSSELDTSSLYYSISGNVFAGSVLLPSGIVVLLKEVNNHYTAIRYCQLNNGHYEFNQLNSGEYTTYCIPNFNLDINYYPSYLPTYFGNNTKWQNSASIDLVNNSLYNKNINLSCNNEILYGPDTISGFLHVADPNTFEYNIYCNNWFGNNSPGLINLELAPNMSVLLLNSNNEPIRYAVSDSLGCFQFKNLPIRIYKISPEKAGLVTIPTILNMQASSATHASTSLFIGSSSIYSNIQDELFTDFENNINIFPNPAHESVILNITTEKLTTISIEVGNLSGSNVLLSDNFTCQGNENFILPISSFSPGVYFVKIKAEGMPVVVKKIIKQ
ncbi:MAG: T9SS type A sorting domain-containing protein [Bacteroidia bacterium]|nr:T9SS type A sorting domain-containing protein [Bacteroidia bacterium]